MRAKLEKFAKFQMQETKVEHSNIILNINYFEIMKAK